MSALIGGREEIQDIDKRFRFEFEVGSRNWRFYDLSRSRRYAVSDETIKGIVVRQNSRDTTREVLDFCDFWYEQPIDLDEDQRLVWFVYAATEFLRSSDGQPAILPNGDVRRDLEPHSCFVKLQWNSGQDICPSRAEFRFDLDLLKNCELMSFEPQGELLNQRAQRLKALEQVFTSEPLMGQFDVLGWTNVSGLGIPRSWRLTVLFNGRPVKSFMAEVDSVGGWSRAPIPSIAPGTLINDKRFHSVRGSDGRVNWLSYSLTSSVSTLPPLNDPQLRALLRHQASRERFQELPDVRIQRQIYLWVIVILLSIPLILQIAKTTKKPVEQKASQDSSF